MMLSGSLKSKRIVRPASFVFGPISGSEIASWKIFPMQSYTSCASRNNPMPVLPSDAIRHRRDALDGVADQEVGLPEVEGRGPGHPHPEHAPEHAAGQGGAQAEVRAATAEADVGWLPGDVELPGI